MPSKREDQTWKAFGVFWGGSVWSSRGQNQSQNPSLVMKWAQRQGQRGSRHGSCRLEQQQRWRKEGRRSLPLTPWHSNTEPEPSAALWSHSATCRGDVFYRMKFKKQLTNPKLEGHGQILDQWGQAKGLCMKVFWHCGVWCVHVTWKPCVSHEGECLHVDSNYCTLR